MGQWRRCDHPADDPDDRAAAGRETCNGAGSALFGRTRWTIRRWIEREGFPASRLPDGAWVTTPTLIDRWVLDRVTKQSE